MKENINRGPKENKTPKDPDGLTLEQRAMADAYLAHDAEEGIEEIERRDCAPEIKEFKEMVASFEAEHSLDDLFAITDLTPAEAMNHPIRESAKKALMPIVEILKTLEGETNITEDNYKELKNEYQRLTQAVGIINSGKVDHTRTVGRILFRR